MTARARQWLLAAVTFAVVVAVTGGWLAYLNARSTPHHQQTAPGAQAVPDFDGGLTVRLLSLVVTPTLVTDKEPAHAPAGEDWMRLTVRQMMTWSWPHYKGWREHRHPGHPIRLRAR